MPSFLSSSVVQERRKMRRLPHAPTPLIDRRSTIERLGSTAIVVPPHRSGVPFLGCRGCDAGGAGLARRLKMPTVALYPSTGPGAIGVGEVDPRCSWSHLKNSNVPCTDRKSVV